MARNVYTPPSLPTLSGVNSRGVNSTPSLPDYTPDPYGQLPDLKPVDNGWYQAELDRLNQLARQSAQQQAGFSQQAAQQYSDFAAQYAQQRQNMLPQSQPRTSKLYILGGY